MRVAVVSSSALLGGPWGSQRFFRPAPSEKARNLARAVRHFRELAADEDRAGTDKDWQALADVVDTAVAVFVVKNSTSTDRGKLNQNAADVDYLVNAGIYRRPGA